MQFDHNMDVIPITIVYTLTVTTLGLPSSWEEYISWSLLKSSTFF